MIQLIQLYDDRPETGFLRQTSLQCKDLGKNPVSKDRARVARI